MHSPRKNNPSRKSYTRLALGCVLGLLTLAAAPQRAAAALLAQYTFGSVDSSYANTDGANPTGTLLLGPGGGLYGTTFDGGANGAGTLFKLQVPGKTLTLLHVFSGGADGTAPIGALAAGPGGMLYGTTSSGGALGGGTVFKVAADGTGFTVLHSFDGSADGAFPGSGLTVGKDGMLYGATTGGVTGNGMAFKVAADGTGFTALHSFTGGEEPLSRLTDGGDGFFYGTTFTGGANWVGTVYRVSTDGKTFTSLYSFTGGGDGGYPQAGVTVAGGVLYGTTSDGQLADSYGTVYRLKTDGTGFATLYNFSGAADGGTPLAPLLLGPGGALYGTTFSGGANEAGTVFQINLDGSAFAVVDSFPGGGGVGGSPSAGLTLGADGSLYGTASEGGSIGSLLTDSSSTDSSSTDGSSTSADQTDGSQMVSPPMFTGSIYRLSAAHLDLLWTNTNGQASVWTVKADGSSAAALYGPFSGWTAKAIAEGLDGSPRLLWTSSAGQAALWNLNDAVPSSSCTIYGPFTGWTATALAVGPDSAAHLLWNNTNGQIALWNTTDNVPSNTAVIYGPYPGWSGKAISLGADNQERLLWNNVSGQAAIWNLADSSPSSTCVLAGPYTGWTPTALAVGPDNAAHLLWDNTSGQTALWNLADSDPAATCTLAGPFGGWNGTALSVGGDNAAHLLWDNVNGTTALWNLADANPSATCTLAGPFGGWTGIGIAASQ